MTDLEFKLTGDLGVLDFMGALVTLQRGHELLLGVQRQVLGRRAGHVRWVLADLDAGSAVTALHGVPLEGDVTDEDLGVVVGAFTSGTDALAHGADEPPRYFDDSVLEAYKNLVTDLQKYQVGDLVATTPGREPVSVPASAVLPPAVVRLEERFTVQGTVIGRIEAINLHERREMTLWSELDASRVRVTFPERLYPAVHAALRCRVEAAGELTEDSFGRPLSLRLEDVEVLPEGEDLPTLASLVGSMPELTAGQDPREWLDRKRRAMGLK
ncbi:MAG: hypothetical protein ACXVXP_10405 [Mycobacteriaceae bacterium]